MRTASLGLAAAVAAVGLLVEAYANTSGLRAEASRNAAADPVVLELSQHPQDQARRQVQQWAVGEEPEFTALTPGQMFPDSIERGSSAYYSVSIPKSSPAYEHIDVVLSPIRGDVDMYITLGADSVPGSAAGEWEYKSESHTGADYDIIRTSDMWYISKCMGLSHCEVRILLQPAPWTSYGNNSFFIGATPSNENLQLQDGIPLYDHASSNTWDYYKFVVDSDPGKDAEVLISLTPFSGDPDCYASTNVSRPTQSNHDPGKSSMRSSRDVIRYYDTDGDYWCHDYPCTFYIGVVAYNSNASYSITAHLRANNSITLVDGQTQLQYVQQSEDLQFVYTIPPESNIMEVIVTPLYGDPDLYVTLDGLPAQPGHSQYSSLASSGTEIVLARPGDGIYDNYCQRNETCPGRIGVYAFDPTLFSILAVSGNALLIPENLPISGIVRKDDVDYFVYEYNGGPNAIVITVTPLSGDVDLYVDNDEGSTQMPGPGHYTWKSIGSRLRQEVIEIFPGDGPACHEGNPCRYYIAVIGYDNTAASYTMVVRTHDSSPTPLLPGQPQLQLLNASSRAFFRLAFPRNVGSSEINLSPTFGDPDLYASWGNRTLTRAQSDYHSTHISGDDTITASRADALDCAASLSVCYLNIMVYSWQDSLFSIVARVGDDSSQLIDGQSVGGSAAAGGYTYYTFQVSSADAPAVFSVAPLSGDPDLYVANTTHPGPTTPGVRRSEGIGHESIQFSQAEIASDCARAGGSSALYPCTLYLAVRAASSRAASWRVLASTTPPTLALGSPSTGSVDRGMLSFYTFHLPASIAANTGSVQVAVTPTSGTILVYVSDGQTRLNEPLLYPRLTCSDGATPPCSVGRAVVSDYKYSSATSLGGQTVTIDDFVPNADYAVAVMASNGIGSPSTVEFEITVTGPDSDRTLSSGVPVDGDVEQGAYEFYRVIISNPGVDVRISLTPYNGDPDLYVSWTPSNKRPNASSYDDRSIGRDDEVVSVLAADWSTNCAVVNNPGGVSQCSIYVGVHGYTAASFSLVALVNTTTSTILFDGQPQTGTLVEGQAAIYSIPINLANPSDSFSIAVIPSGGDPDLYINKGSPPGRTPGTYQHKSNGAAGTELINIGPNDTSHCSSSCAVYALVFGYTQAEYQIVYQSNGVVTQLRDGVPHVGTGGSSETSYFAINVPAGSSQLKVVLTVLSGDSNLYMDVETGPDVRPNPSNGARWSSAIDGDDSITVGSPTVYCPSSVDAGIVRSTGFGLTGGGCNFVIGVFNKYASRFTLVATLSERTVTQLVEGNPQQGVATGSDFVYFYSILPHVSPGSTVEFDVTVSTTSGGVDLFATDAWDPNSRPGEPGSELPNTTYWRYSTTSPTNRGGRNAVTVVWDGEPPPKYGFLAIAVRSRQAGNSAPFTISSSSSETITTLQLSRPSPQRSIITGETQHFLVQVTDISEDLVFSLNAFRGYVYAVVSTGISRPYCMPAGGNSIMTDCVGTWQANSATKPNLRISATNPCKSAFNGSCANAGEFKTGPFYIGVYGAFNGEYSLTVQQLTPTTLSDGRPERGQTDSKPIIFALQLAGEAAAHDVKFRLTRIDSDGRQTTSGDILGLHVKSCVADQCTAKDKHPNASNSDLSLLVDKSVAARTAIAAANTGAHCQPPSANCVYYLAVTSVCDPGVDACPTDFQVVASSQSGTAVTLIDYSSISTDVAQRSASIPANQNAEFEVYLNPTTANPTTDVMFSVEACGPGMPDIFVCDSTCEDPFNPSRANHTFSAQTSTSQGKATIRVPATRDTALYAAVAASAESTGSASFVFAAGANNPYILVPSSGASGPTVELGSSELDIDVSWEPVQLQSGSTKFTASQVSYEVVLGKDGFTGSGFVATTACGLQQISETDGVITRVTALDATSANIGGLIAETEYSANVIATCDAACLQASIKDAQVVAVRNEQGEWVPSHHEAEKAAQGKAELLAKARALTAARSAPKHSNERRMLLDQAGGQSATQAIAIGKVSWVTTGQQPPAPEPEEGFPQGAIIGLSVMGGILLLGGIGFVVYRRMQAGSYRVQYRAFRGDGAMDTLPMPASGYAAMFDD